MDSETLKLVGFRKVLELLQNLAQTSAGRRSIEEMRPSGDSGTALERLRIIEELIQLHGEGSGFDLSVAEGLDDIVAQLSLPGTILDPERLLGLGRSLKLSSRLSEAFHKHEKKGLSALACSSQPLAGLSHEIETAIDDTGHIRDAADRELAAIRKKVKAHRRRVQKCLDGYLTGKQARYLISEPYVTRRNERMVIPVRSEAQNRVPGVVHGSSGSGATVFLEPLEAVDLNNRLVQSEIREIQVTRRVLARLTDSAGTHLAELALVVDQLALLDACQAAREFWNRHNCCLPVFREDGGLRLEEARHPLLEVSEASVVPVTICLSGEERILVISGPNTGGKTVSLKTIGLFSCLAQAGLPVPAARAEFPLCRGIFADIGDHQSIDRQLSTFSAHLLRAAEILQKVEPPSLVLLDEIGSGTDPAFGTALAVVLMEELSRNARVVVTTHLDRIKEFAATRKGAVNASVGLDSETLAPSFHLAFGQPGTSSAFEIAAQLGFPEKLLGAAREQLSSTRQQVEDYLALLRKQSQDLGVRQQQIETAKEKFRQRKLELDQERENLRGRSRRRLEARLDELEKEFRTESRRIIRGFQDKMGNARLRKEAERQRGRLREVFREQVRRESHQEQKAVSASEALKVGADVWAPGLRRRGRITRIDHEEASVDIEGKRLRIKLAQLEPVSSERGAVEARPQITMQIVEDTSRELNLIGKRAEEAIRIADKFLDRAFVSGVVEVRLVHGFGTGRLQKALEGFLSGHPQVSRFHAEGGATMVALR